MADNFTVTASIHGGPELSRKLKQLADAVAAEALELACVAGALPIQNDAKRKCPKKTRTLSRSIHIGGHSDKASDFEGEDIGGNESSRDSATVQIGTNVVYAAIQEFGGEVHQTNAFGKGIKATITIPAHPYLRPAFDENQDAATNAAGRALKQLITKAAGGEA